MGLEAVVWLALLLLTFFFPEPPEMEPLAGWESLITILVLALAYVLGILVDRLSDSVYNRLRKTKWGRTLRGWIGMADRSMPAKVSLMRLRVMESEDGKAKFGEYQRSRLRIARATVVNLACLMPAGGLYVLRKTALGWDGVIAFETFVLAFLLLSIFVTERIQRAYSSRLLEAYQMWLEDSEAKKKTLPTAAVGRGGS